MLFFNILLFQNPYLTNKYNEINKLTTDQWVFFVLKTSDRNDKFKNEI